MGLREQILEAKDLPLEPVEVPEWGLTVFVRTFTGTERDQFEESTFAGRGGNAKVNYQNIRARLVVLCTVDENGKRIFTDADMPAVGKKSSKALDRIFEKAQEVNGLREKDVEELAKNSGSGPSAAFGTASLDSGAVASERLNHELAAASSPSC